jgi:hypothetical protein
MLITYAFQNLNRLMRDYFVRLDKSEEWRERGENLIRNSSISALIPVPIDVNGKQATF